MNTRKRRSPARAAMAVALVLTAATAVTAIPGTAVAAGNYPNAAIADHALTRVGQVGGQCRAFVNNVVWVISGNTQNISSGGDYFQSFLNAGGQEITNSGSLARGDIVQVGQGIHTFIIVGYVGGATFNVVDSNHSYNEVVQNYNRTFSLGGDTRAFRMGSVAGIPAANREVLSLAGNWSGDARQDFAYVTRRADGGFEFAVMESTATGLAWRGIWWSAPGLSFDTTKFIPADTDGDGLLDLYYATVGGGGFALALMHNAGGSFTWWGHQWNPQLDLATVRFLPGDWTGDSRDEFAYVTPTSSGGFGFAVMETTDAGLVWRGLWWVDNNLAYASTAFIPADNDNDGKLDLFYASPSPTGFAVALMHNTGNSFAWWGHQWNPVGLTLSTTRFLPGDWGGGPEDDFAYVTPRSDGGFDLARFISTPSGIVWQDGLHQPNLAFSTVQFITADADADGYTDLYYVTPRAGSGFDMALFHNTGSGFVWSGLQWSPAGLTQQQTVFLPQR